MVVLTYNLSMSESKQEDHELKANFGYVARYFLPLLGLLLLLHNTMTKENWGGKGFFLLITLIYNALLLRDVMAGT